MSRLRWLARGETSLPADASWLAPGEALRAAGMRFTKRRTEYLVRRWAAKHAVATELGLPFDPVSLARVEVRNAATGAPEVWVDGLRTGLGVSLTDRAGWAVCLVCAEPMAVGCDLEVVEPRSPAFVREFFTETERRAVRAAGWEADRQVVANLIWSAKESALKVLQTGLRRDARSVQVRLPARAPDPGGWATLAIQTVEGRELPGWWCRHGDFLLTVAYGAPAAAPVSIEGPPALAAAAPVHSWLGRAV
jgi:4'-phosphopantetheinyl transferase